MANSQNGKQPEPETIYIVLAIVTTMPAKVQLHDSDAIIDVDMKWYKDQIGAIPVFSDHEAAKKCAGDKFKILEIKSII